MTPPDLHLVKQERPTLPPDAAASVACEIATHCPGIEQIVVDLGVMRADVERLFDRVRKIDDRLARIEAEQRMQISAQHRTNTLLASLLERLP